jgi:hypothetical protein
MSLELSHQHVEQLPVLGINLKPATLNALRETIEASGAAITPDTQTAVVRSAVRRHGRCLAADGGHFEHIQ